MMKLTATQEKQAKAVLAGYSHAELQTEIGQLEYAKTVAAKQGLDTSDLDYAIRLRQDAMK